MMNEFLASPKANDDMLPLPAEEESNEEDSIKVRLFFFTEDKKLSKDVFTDEWYLVTSDTYGNDEVSRDFQPWVDVSSNHTLLIKMQAQLVPHHEDFISLHSCLYR